MHHISKKEYDHAAITAATHADYLLSQPVGQSESSLAKPLLCIAKLTAMIHGQKSNTVPSAASSPAVTVSSSSGSKTVVSLSPVPKVEMKKTEEEVEIKLALLKVEEDVIHLLPR
jgi:hypothetical protein